jgi:REP element-mobilizing transposase RayT
METQRNTHHVFRLMYHFVWIPKYRHKVFIEPYRATMKAIIKKIGYDYDILELQIREDHIYMVIRGIPKQSPNDVMQIMKSITAKMIRLTGLTVMDKVNPEGDIAIEYTGLRQGEKLFEELLIGDDITQTDHRRIMSAHELSIPWPELEKILVKLDEACHEFAHEDIRRLLLQAPTGFVPKDGICDLVWNAKEKNI